MQPLLLELGSLINFRLPPGGAIPVGDSWQLNMVGSLRKSRVLNLGESATRWGDVPSHTHNRCSKALSAPNSGSPAPGSVGQIGA